MGCFISAFNKIEPEKIYNCLWSNFTTSTNNNKKIFQKINLIYSTLNHKIIFSLQVFSFLQERYQEKNHVLKFIFFWKSSRCDLSINQVIFREILITIPILAKYLNPNDCYNPQLSWWLAPSFPVQTLKSCNTILFWTESKMLNLNCCSIFYCFKLNLKCCSIVFTLKKKKQTCKVCNKKCSILIVKEPLS